MDKKLLVLLLSAFLLVFSVVFLARALIKKSLLSPFSVVSQKHTDSIFPLNSMKISKKPTNVVDSSTPMIPPKFCTYVPVLLYHHIQSMETAKKYKQEYLTVEPSIFEEHVKRLKDKDYKFISAEELADAVSLEKPLPENTVVLTFDDGYSNLYGDAFKIAKKYKAVMNIMIITSLVGKGGYLSWEQIKDMEKSGLVYFYNHTAAHYALNYLNKDQITYQVMSAQTLLEKNLKRVPKIIVYPMGFYNDFVVVTLKELGFNQGFGTESGIYQCDTNIMHLQRLRMGNTKIEYYGF